MLLSKKVELKWNPKNKNYYQKLGYQFTKMGDSFQVNVSDLSKGCNSIVEIKCDFCNKIIERKWNEYLKTKTTISKKDCCDEVDCLEKKVHDSINIKYNTDSVFNLDDVKAKIKKKFIEKYGVENPFSSEIIKKQIRTSNLEKYGVEYTMQNPEIVEKSQKTCIEKYGVKNYGIIYSREHKKEKSPSWKGGVAYSRVERSTCEYSEWRKKVFIRDKYTCQCCGAKNEKGLGKTITLIGHHINNWKTHIEERYDVNNGITLCERCHILFHSKYGKKDNNIQQIIEFINNNKNIDEKIC